MTIRKFCDLCDSLISDNGKEAFIGREFSVIISEETPEKHLRSFNTSVRFGNGAWVELPQSHMTVCAHCTIDIVKTIRAKQGKES